MNNEYVVMNVVRGGILSVTLLIVSCFKLSDVPDVVIPMSFSGGSDLLTMTEVVPTLDSPIHKGRNAIWCASFQCAWKALEGLAGETISIEGTPSIVESLNNAANLTAQIPDESFYVAVGWNKKGMVRTIQNDFRQKFPSKQSPEFLGITNDSYVAYSYLEANSKCKLPYCHNDKPLTFTSGDGKKADVSSFGLLPHDSGKFMKLRAQGRVLFYKLDDESHKMCAFAINLCSDSLPSQIVVAQISRGSSLAATLAAIESEAKAWKKTRRREDLEKIGPSDVLLVPDFYWSISHIFAEVQGKSFENTELTSQRLDIARQDILFCLDKGGAVESSTAWITKGEMARRFFFDRPFLVYMKKRGATTPYFVMWVDNAELMQPWGKGKQDSRSPKTASH